MDKYLAAEEKVFAVIKKEKMDTNEPVFQLTHEDVAFTVAEKIKDDLNDYTEEQIHYMIKRVSDKIGDVLPWSDYLEEMVWHAKDELKERQ